MNLQTTVIGPIMPKTEATIDKAPEVKEPEPVKQKIQAPYKFTEPEQISLGQDLVRSMRNQDQIAAEFDTIKKQFKYREDQAQLDTDIIRRKLQDGFEMRETTARVEFNKPVSGRKSFFNDTTHEFIREEAMTAADMQPALIPGMEETEEAEVAE